MQGILLNTKRINTKFGEKVVCQVILESNQLVTLWEVPKPVGCISSLPEKTLIGVRKTKTGYAWDCLALVGPARKEAISKYAVKSISCLFYLHSKIVDQAKNHGVELNNSEVAQYAIAVYFQISHRFD